MGDLPRIWPNLQARLLRRVDRLASTLAVFRRPFDPEELIRTAQQREGLDDFGDWSFQEPLAVLLSAYDREANLSAFGRIAVRWDMLRFLSNLLRLRDEEKRSPGILAERINRPIFILGLPRSGTTFLHNLLAQDPANLAPRCWQTIYPYPERGRPSADPWRRRDLVARQFANFLRFLPELPDLHPLEADAAQECIEITGQVIRSLRFDTTHYVPTYQQWLDDAGHHEAYHFHRRFLQHLQHQSGSGCWILKSPDHIFALGAIDKVYPDARFVFVHRDPMEVLPSVARLTELLRLPFTRQVDRMQIGRQVSDRWVEGSKLLIDADQRLRTSPKRIFHIRYRNLVRNPSGAVKSIYNHFGLPLSPKARANVNRSIANRPNGGYGQNQYHLEDYGLNLEAERRRYAGYVEYFRTDTKDAVDSIEPLPNLRMAT